MLAGAALAATLLGSLLLPATLPAQGVGPEVGSTLPTDLQLEDLDGRAVTLGRYMEAGTPTLVEIWASWCENCEALQPQLDRIVAQHGDEVRVVAIAVAVSQSRRRVRRHVDAHGHEYPYLWDGRGEAVRALEAATTSIVILADGQGRIVYTGVGGDQDLVGEVRRLLSNPTER
jgi:thiol-disulfide isomerase/thioredoxin